MKRKQLPEKVKNKVQRRRGIGRPHISGDTVGRDALIAATKELLKRVPPAKLTRIKIAQSARVTPALVRYYFGNTEKLLRATTILLAREHRANSRARIAAAKTAKEKLRARIAVLTETLMVNPHFNQLLLEQVVHGKGSVAKRAFDLLSADSLSELSAILEDGVRRRELRPVDVNFMYCALIGLSEFFASNRPMLESLFGPGKFDAELANRYVAFVFDLIMNGISVTRSRG